MLIRDHTPEDRFVVLFSLLLTLSFDTLIIIAFDTLISDILDAVPCVGLQSLQEESGESQMRFFDTERKSKKMQPLHCKCKFAIGPLEEISEMCRLDKLVLGIYC